MASATVSPTKPAPALLFIPDISGFTQFVNDTEISHAQHIIQELLDILLNSNQIGMEVSEVEGDAILFYKFGNVPSAAALLEQVKKMFTEFHLHLMKYDSHRICDCGACQSAKNLTLKFIAHYGDVAINQVQQFKKLFGIDVITAHRLLKNDIDKHEYFMMTSNLKAVTPDADDVLASTWSDPKQSAQLYDSGKVEYTYLYMDSLYDHIPPLTHEDFRLKGKTSKVLESSTVINAPLRLVFDVVSDVSWRGKWIPGTLPEADNVNSFFAQAGQTHRCMANGPVLVAHDFSKDKDTIYFRETASKSHTAVYQIKRISPNQTRLQLALYIQGNIMKETVFKLLMKKKMAKMFEVCWTNLKGYCEELYNTGKTHSYNIVYQVEADAGVLN